MLAKLKSMTPAEIAWQLLWRGARVWLVAFAILFVAQRNFLYVPSGGEVTPAAAGLAGFTSSN